MSMSFGNVCFSFSPDWMERSWAKGAHLVQCAHSATVWVCGHTKDPYFVILGA